MQYVYKSNHINRTLLKGTCSSMQSYNPVVCYLPYTMYMFETRTFQLSPSGKTFSFHWIKWLTSHLQLFWNMMKLLNAPTKQYNAKHLRPFSAFFQQRTDLLILLTCAICFSYPKQDCSSYLVFLNISGPTCNISSQRILFLRRSSTILISFFGKIRLRCLQKLRQFNLASEYWLFSNYPGQSKSSTQILLLFSAPYCSIHTQYLLVFQFSIKKT